MQNSGLAIFYIRILSIK